MTIVIISFQIFWLAAYIEDYHVNLGELLRSGNLLKAQSIGILEGQGFTPDAKILQGDLLKYLSMHHPVFSAPESQTGKYLKVKILPM